jgi:thioredoxin 1
MVQDQPIQNKPVQQKATQGAQVQGTPVIDKPIHVTDDDFDKVIRENKYVIVDFWAEWCRPCHAIAPMIDEFAKKYAGKVVFAKIDSDENQKKFQEYGVMGIPTLLFFKDGKLVDQVIGAMPKGPFEQRVLKHLG